MTARILPEPEQTPTSIHVVPLDIDDERGLALLARYVEAIESGQHPPYWYVSQVFAALYAIGMARRAEGGA